MAKLKFQFNKPRSAVYGQETLEEKTTALASH